MKRISLGIDIGGTNTVFGVVDSDGKIYAEASVSTSDYSTFSQYPQYVEAVAAGMRTMLSQLDFEYELVGIGVGAPNASYSTGIIDRPANLWKFSFEGEGCEKDRVFHLADDLHKQFPECKYVLITNDANAATIGEMMFGAARGMKDFVMITLGTGLGSGFVAGGELIYGSDGMAGELGHIVAVRGGRECGCGLKGCLETYVSATGIKRTAFEVMCELRTPSPLRDISFNEMESLTIAKAAQQGDQIALETFRRTAEVLGQALADVVAIMSPEAFVLFGGLAKAGDLILKPTFEYMEENTVPVFKSKTKLLLSGVQDANIAILGSAALVWKRDAE